ncbi:MAG: hypothetical protein II054_02595, partial [Treponema sp.]|nr:hypothetical protein [Treponema sp.]
MKNKFLKILLTSVAAIGFLSLSSCKTQVDEGQTNEEKTNEEKTSYKISVSECTGGYISTNVRSAVAGKAIYIYSYPDEDFKLGAYSVKDSAGNDVPVTGNKFTMPESDVTVSATFEAIQYVTYTVTFDKNAEDATGTMEAQTFVEGRSQDLTENK